MTEDTFTTLGAAASAVVEKLVPLRDPTPIDMLSMAVEKGAPIEVLEKLMGLQERWEARRARKAFDSAIADAKAEIPPIVKNAKGHNDKPYADFAAIATVVDPILSRHGLSYRFRTVQDEKNIRTTCVLSHREGHAEEATLSGPADTTGNKNAIQSIGSTLSYLQRYSLIQSLGLSATEDDDGVKSGSSPIDDDQIDVLQKLIKSIDKPNAEKTFLEYFRIGTVSDLPSKDYERAVKALQAKMTRR